jgi:hypothetical protein
MVYAWRSDGGKLLGRTLHGIVEQFYGNISIVVPSAKVITIEPSADALSVEEVMGLFSMAFEQVCALKEVQRLGIDSFVQTRPAPFVETIRPAKEALSMEGSTQNLNRGFVDHLRKFPEWLKRKPDESKESFSHSRFHIGIEAHPANLH